MSSVDPECPPVSGSVDAAQELSKAAEEEIEKYLQIIHNKTTQRDSEIFCYRFGSLFPDAKISSILEGYRLLRHSEDFYYFALSLVLFMVDGHTSKEEMESLFEIVKRNTVYETDIRKQRLNLRRLLSSIASELKEDAIRELSNVTGRMLDLNTDRIIVDEKYSLATALSAFQKLEEKDKFKLMLEDRPSDHDLCPLSIILKRIQQPKLIKQYVERYNPHQPITIAVMKVQRLSKPKEINAQEQQLAKDRSDYRASVVATYNAMSVIESNQWPPVKGHFYINLALITSEFMPRSDKFSRATVRGSVDDVYKKKLPIEFDKVFPECIASEKHYVSLIEGCPGSGKSTLITKVSKDWAEGKVLKDVDIFILVRLRRFVEKEDLSLMDILGTYCSNPDVVKAVHDAMTRNAGKGVCFAFDGLDEYSSKLQSKNFIMKLIHGHVLPHATIFLTSRPATSERFRHKMIITQRIEIIGFLEKQITEYIQSYYKEEPGKAYGLNKYITDHPNIKRMCYLPLHIAMVIFLYDLDPNGDFLPSTETELYSKFTLHTLVRSLQRDPDEDYDPDDDEIHEFDDLPEDKRVIFQQVCQLAFMATKEQKQLFTGREIKKYMTLPKKRDFDSLGLLTVDRMIAESSFLTKTFSFLHLTHQEFLAAVHLVHYKSDSEQLAAVQELAGEVRMWVVWKFLCGLYAKKRMNLNDSLEANDTFSKAFKLIISENVSTRLASVNMMHCAFESLCPVACSDLLNLLGGIIDAVDVALNPSDCSALGYVMAKAPKEVKKVDFSYSHQGPAGIAAFVQQLEKLHGPLPEVDLLRLRANIDKPIGPEGAHDLKKLLYKLPNLGELRLYGNKLKTQMFQVLYPAIGELRKLHTLILSRNDLEVDTGPLMSEVLSNLSLLHTFYISYNPLTEVGLGNMKPGLLKCSELKILGVRGTHLGEGAGIHLREILTTLKKLEVLELYQNKLGDKGVIDMVTGLLSAQSLQTMSLVENGISDTGAFALVPYLKVTKTLTQMRIYYNHGMTDKGQTALRTAAVERPSHLCHLGLAV